jgi:hypothetical protein
MGAEHNSGANEILERPISTAISVPGIRSGQTTEKYI